MRIGTLENRQGRKPLVGSNPTPSATKEITDPPKPAEPAASQQLAPAFRR
jgi:hypothetical protein